MDSDSISLRKFVSSLSRKQVESLFIALLHSVPLSSRCALESGQYAKVKKQLSAWAKIHVERHEDESKYTFSRDDFKVLWHPLFSVVNDQITMTL